MGVSFLLSKPEGKKTYNFKPLDLNLRREETFLYIKKNLR
jgi:hypothetical protein